MSERRVGAPTARLVDMEVQEVSLVDRAANKRKFLIVKRSEGMGQESSPGTSGEGSENQDGHEGEDGSDASDEGIAEQSPLEVAATAFDGVTSAMARLQSAGAEGLRGELENVVEELRGAASALEQQLAGEPDDSDEHAEAEDQDPEVGEDATAALGPLIGAMKDLTTELRAARTGRPVAKAGRKGGKASPPRGGAGGGRGADEDEPDEEEDEDEDEDEDEEPPVRRGPPPRPTPKRKGAATRPSQGLQADVRALRGDLKTFSTSLTEQARRLAKLEKRAAPPSSRPVGERLGGPRPSHEAWPLDLNAPRGR